MLCLMLFFFFSSRRRHTRFDCDWSSDVCSSDLGLRFVSLEEQRGKDALRPGLFPGIIFAKSLVYRGTEMLFKRFVFRAKLIGRQLIVNRSAELASAKAAQIGRKKIDLGPLQPV